MRIRRIAKWFGLVASIVLLAIMSTGFGWYATCMGPWRGVAASDGAVVVAAFVDLNRESERLGIAPPRGVGDVEWHLRACPMDWQWIPRRVNGPSDSSWTWMVWTLPAWIPLVIIGTPTLLLFCRPGPPRPGHCPKCRYDLRGLAPDSPCPECGRAAPAPSAK